MKMKEGNDMRFINDDVTLLHDRRVAPYSNSINELIHILEREAIKNGCDRDGCEIAHTKERGGCEPIMIDADLWSQKMIKAIMKNDPIIREDNVFGVGIENFMCNHYPTGKNDLGEHLLGLRRLDSGFAFYGFIAGGDGQRGVFTIMYHDGENLRLYTPRWGNKLNLNRQETLMNDSRSEKYMKKYGLDKSTLGFNWNAMKIDIMANFTIDYSHVVEHHLRTIESEKD